jgi:aspartate/methionine/tyrosine aminotransferase
MCRLRQFTVFAAATPFQFAIAAGLHFADSYFHQLAAEYQSRRDLLVQALADCALQPNQPAGSFFVLVDLSSLPSTNGRDFCNDLARNCGVAPIPMDTFYLNQHYGERIARFTFSVRQEILEMAARRLAKRRTGCWAER